MGTRSTNNGISVQLCFEDGSPNGLPLYGQYAVIFGKPQEDVLAAGPAATLDEQAVKGSSDWLTLVAVADSQDKLDRIVAESGGPGSRPQTSHSSRRVSVELDIGGRRQSFKNRVTIASGPIVSTSPPVIDVVHVKVLPDGINMGKLDPKKNSLAAEFTGGAIFTE